jgi:hypothetical protein
MQARKRKDQPKRVGIGVKREKENTNSLWPDHHASV